MIYLLTWNNKSEYRTNLPVFFYSLPQRMDFFHSIYITYWELGL